MNRILLSLFLLSSMSLFAQTNDLCVLSDDFSDRKTLSNWQRVNEVEQWFADDLQTWSIDPTTGHMVMIPHTVTWYRDYRGPLAFKEVSGDVVLTVSVRTTGRDGTSVPTSAFSLAGIFLRAPRDITPATWTPGGENYVFLSIGQANNGGSHFQYEVKTTMNSSSILEISDAPDGEVWFQVARLGSYLILLRWEPDTGWLIHRRYNRSDFPETLQVGLGAYTDWTKVSIFEPFVHNSNVLAPPLPDTITDPNPSIPFAPDLIASFGEALFFRPSLPVELENMDLSDSNAVPNEVLLTFLGDAAIGQTCPCTNEETIFKAQCKGHGKQTKLQIHLSGGNPNEAFEIVLNSGEQKTGFLNDQGIAKIIFRGISSGLKQATVRWACGIEQLIKIDCP